MASERASVHRDVVSLPVGPLQNEESLCETAGEPEPEFCRKLRSKFAFSAVVTSDGEPISALAELESTAVYYCLSTMECVGPDGGLVHGTLCGPERLCHISRG